MNECFWNIFTKLLAAKQQDQLLITLLNFAFAGGGVSVTKYFSYVVEQ
jgi:hypothetical protein